MLTLTGVRKRFGETQAVDGLSLTINRGEVLGLLGPNGAGKTTAIRMAVGLLMPDEGSVDLAGVGSPRSSVGRGKIGLAPQSIALYDDLTARENLEFLGCLHGLSRADRRARSSEILERIGLADRAAHRVGTFSGGMKRRLNLGAAIVHRPALLMLDEPTAGVDPHSRNALFDVVEALKADGVTVLYTTHYMEEAQRLCDRVAIMDHGRLLALDTVEGLLARYGGKTVLFAERSGEEERIESDNPVADRAKMLERGDVTGVRMKRADLESVFLAMTGRRLRD